MAFLNKLFSSGAKKKEPKSDSEDGQYWKRSFLEMPENCKLICLFLIDLIMFVLQVVSELCCSENATEKERNCCLTPAQWRD